MSEVASLVPFGEFHSALFYRDLYLRDETEYKPFWCPFCGITLFAVLIYKPANAELSRSPHFRESEPHRHGCDGNPAKAGKVIPPVGPVRKIEKQLFTLPTRLIEYVEPPTRIDPVEPGRVPSPSEVRKRREQAGQIHHRARFSVALVQSIGEAHLGTLSQAYKLQEEKSWSDKERNSWLSSIFSTEIDLRGLTMTYKEALQDLYFPVRPAPRIYHSEGIVVATDNGYVISASRQGRTSDTDRVGLPFSVIVRADCSLSGLRGARRELMAQLQLAATQQSLVKWYGYGVPHSTTERLELRFDSDNLSDLFIRRKPGGKVKARAGQLPAKASVSSAVQSPVTEPRLNRAPGNAATTPALRSDANQKLQITEKLARSTPASAPEVPLAISHAVAPRSPATASTASKNDRFATQEHVETETTARLDARHAAVLREYDAYCTEQTEAAAKVVADFRTNKLAPHRERKPLLWGRAAWKATLAELEAIDSRNVAHWKRLQQRRFTPQEAERAKTEAKRRAGLTDARV